MVAALVHRANLQSRILSIKPTISTGSCWTTAFSSSGSAGTTSLPAEMLLALKYPCRGHKKKCGVTGRDCEKAGGQGRRSMIALRLQKTNPELCKVARLQLARNVNKSGDFVFFVVFRRHQTQALQAARRERLTVQEIELQQKNLMCSALPARLLTSWKSLSGRAMSILVKRVTVVSMSKSAGWNWNLQYKKIKYQPGLEKLANLRYCTISISHKEFFLKEAASAELSQYCKKRVMVKNSLETAPWGQPFTQSLRV